MIKLFLLFLMAWLRGIPGAGGLLLLGLYLFYMLRYRGYYGRLSEPEKATLRLQSDVGKHDMRSQWDVIPWPGTSKHVIRKWTWDRIALDTTLKKSVETTRASLSNALKKLDAYSKQHSSSGHHPYSGTLAVFDSSQMRHTPTEALDLVSSTLVKSGNDWTDQAICMLGGTFVICAESYKKDIKKHFDENKKKEPRMASGTDAELSRFTWKIGQFATTLKFPTGLADFLHSVLRRLNPWDRHAVVKYRDEDYYAPTTMFGASATIMKVLKLCEAIGLNDDDKMFVGYSVALHWIDKYLNDDSWVRGGVLTPDRHSLLEALQGMYAYIQNDPTAAADALVKMYQEADEARLADKRR
ncbi:hypothetical protein BO221_18915 [Archangium sp. Cb G35]|uniref:hypothetical protein n=1 Tax=Archangium sp. Cb G35 TaxID=1920190 RepID=UPI00093577D2|nr:hypothetical protein [Archangium sp. Cb G35]OJT22969.1 hypothetical protein BO221_18915 [Archangium sp. Cb G35]